MSDVSGTLSASSPAGPGVDGRSREYVSSSSQTLLQTLAELWQHRELLYFLAWRDVTIRYRQTMLGAVWALLQPFITMVVFTVLFGVIVRMPTDEIPAPIFYFSALLPWLYFAGAMNTTGNSLVGNSDLIKKVYFPRLVLPASGALIGVVDFAIGAMLLIAMMVYYDVLSWRILLWIPFTALLWSFSFAVGVLLSAVNVRYRDVKHAIPFMVQIWMFLTPVIYPTSVLNERAPQFAWLIKLNPLTGIIEAFRASTVPSATINWNALLASAITTLVLVIIGVSYFRRVEGYFTDIV